MYNEKSYKSHDHLSRRFDDQNQKILNENLDSYVARKQDIVDCLRRKERYERGEGYWFMHNVVYQHLPSIYTNVCLTVNLRVDDDMKPYSWFAPPKNSISGSRGLPTNDERLM